jgi:hypothetical protein
MIPHAWHDVGATAGKMLVVVQPSGNIEAFSEDLERLSMGEIGATLAHSKLYLRNTTWKSSGLRCRKNLSPDFRFSPGL